MGGGEVKFTSQIILQISQFAMGILLFEIMGGGFGGGCKHGVFCGVFLRFSILAKFALPALFVCVFFCIFSHQRFPDFLLGDIFDLKRFHILAQFIFLSNFRGRGGG